MTFVAPGMRLLVTLMLLLVGFAGCAETADEPEAEPEPTTSEEPEGTSEPDPTGSAEPEPEPSEEHIPLAPEATLEVETANGTELAINYTINATDPDGDLSSWSLTLGDGNTTNGTEFPSNGTYVFAAAGTYNVTLTVVDSTGLNGTAKAVVNITEAGVATIEFIVELDLPCTQCTDAGSLFCAERQTGQEVGDCRFVPIAEELRGAPFSLTSTGGDPEAFFWNNACGSGTSDSFKNAGNEEGTVPMDAVCVLLWEYEAAGSTLTLRIG